MQHCQCPKCKSTRVFNHQYGLFNIVEIYSKTYVEMNSVTKVYECKCGEKFLVINRTQLDLFKV